MQSTGLQVVANFFIILEKFATFRQALWPILVRSDSWNGWCGMSAGVRGLAWCFTFVVLEAVQAVFFGGVFQRLDSFLVGTAVFGLTTVGSLAWTYSRDRRQLEAAFQDWPALIGLNVTAAGGWLAYFIAVQLLEPAVAFAIFSGAVPVTVIVLGRCRFGRATAPRNRLEVIGNLVLCTGMSALATFTLFGWSGFVRGGMETALAGLALSAASGALIAGMLIFSGQLDRKGAGPVAQLGLRFPLYVVLSGIGFWLRIDGKGPVPPADLIYAVTVGLIVMAFPIYAVQKAVSLTSSLTIGAVTALGPIFVFLFQLAEGRVAYAQATVIGLIIYFLGAVIAVIGSAITLDRRVAA